MPGPDFGADAKVAMVTPTLLLSTNSSRIRPKLWVFVLKCPKLGRILVRRLCHANTTNHILTVINHLERPLG